MSRVLLQLCVLSLVLPLAQPTQSNAPSAAPTLAPTPPTRAPSAAPTAPPTPPDSAPTSAPMPPTHAPTSAPTVAPTPPTSAPTHAPTPPTSAPSAAPSSAPSSAPTAVPSTAVPTAAPTPPTHAPTSAPTPPTNSPTNAPTQAPTPPTHAPTAAPTPPTFSPTSAPTHAPTPPTSAPTQAPTSSPTYPTGIDVSSPRGISFGPLDGELVPSTATAAGSCVTFHYVALLGPPAAGATVTVTVHSESVRAIVTPSTVAFDASNWQSKVKVCVRAANDGVDRSDEGSQWIDEDETDLDARRIVLWHSAAVTAGTDLKYAAYSADAVAPSTSKEWSCYVGVGHGFRTNALDVTAKGLTCQDWDVQMPHAHPMVLPHVAPGAGLGAHAKCRNPHAVVTPFPTPAPTFDSSYLRFYRFSVTAMRDANLFRPSDAGYPYMLAEFALWRNGRRLNEIADMNAPEQTFPVVTATVAGITANETIDGDATTFMSTVTSGKWGFSAWSPLVIDIGDDEASADTYGWLVSADGVEGAQPMAWTLDGSINGLEWRVISVVEDGTVFGADQRVPGEWQMTFMNQTWPTMAPTVSPTVSPTQPTMAPSLGPTKMPTFGNRRRRRLQGSGRRRRQLLATGESLPAATAAPTPAYGAEKPWCYTTDAKTPWGYCDVKACGATALAVAVANGAKAAVVMSGILTTAVLLEPGVCSGKLGGNVSDASINKTGTVALATIPRHNVTVYLSGGTQIHIVPSTLVFGPLHAASQSFVLSAREDLRNEAAVHSATVTATASSMDGLYNGTAHAVSLSVQECDVSAILVSPSDAVLYEAGSATVAVRLATLPSTAVAVNVTLPQLEGITVSATEGGVTSAVVSSCGTGGDECILPFTTASAAQYFDVTFAYADGTTFYPRRNISALFRASSSDGAYDAMEVSADVMLVDNDVPGIRLTNIGVSGLSVREPSTANGCAEWWTCDGYFANYSVVLKTSPRFDVIIAINGTGQIVFLVPTSSDAHAVVGQTSITFTKVLWNVPQRVVITGFADANEAEEAWHRATIVHVATSADAVYDGQTISTPVTVADSDTFVDDTPAPVVIAVGQSEFVLGRIVVRFNRTTNRAGMSSAGAWESCDPVLSVDTRLRAGDGILCAWPAAESGRVMWIAQSSNALVPGSNISIVVGAIRSTTMSVHTMPAVSRLVAPRTAAPNMVSAQFANSGGSLNIVFDRATDRAASNGLSSRGFPCTKLFNSTSSATAEAAGRGIGPNAWCVFPTATTLDIMLGAGATIVPGDALPHFSSGAVRPLFGSAVWTEIANVGSAGAVLAPPSPPAVHLEVDAPTRIGVCDDFIASTRLSYNTGGRALVLEWLLVDASAAWLSSAMRSNVTVALESATSASSSSITIDSDVLLPSEWLTISVNARNFLNPTVATQNITVSKASFEIPFVAIAGAASRTVTRSESLLLYGRGYAPACDGSDTGRALRYSWSASSNPSGAFALGSANVANNPRNLKIPANQLVAGSTVFITLNVSLVDNEKSANVAIVVLTVANQPLVAIIGGGGRRIGEDDALTIDGSSSHDPDGTDVLTYVWSSVPSVSAIAVVTAPSLVLSGGTLSGGTVYAITLTVSANGRVSSSAGISIDAVVGSTPQISVVWDYKHSKFSSADSLILRGGLMDSSAVLMNASEMAWSWSVTSGNMNVNNAANFLTTLSTPFLVIAKSVLTPGSIYTFRLRAVHATRGVGIASVTVPVNKPPYMGTLQSTPLNGTVLLTKFELLAAFVEDDEADKPLRYSFAFTRVGAESDGSTVLRSYSEESQFSTLLPQGEADASYAIVITAWAQDMMGATSIAPAQLTVRCTPPKDLSIDAIANNTAMLFADALHESDPDTVINVVTASAMLLRDTAPSVSVSTPAGSPTFAPTSSPTTAAQLETRIAFRSTLANALLQAAPLMEVTVEALAQQTSSALLVSSAPAELRSEAQTTISELMRSVTAGSFQTENGLEAATSVGIASALANVATAALASGSSSAAASGRRRRLLSASSGAAAAASPSLLANITDNLALLSLAMISHAVADQHAATLTTPLFEMESQRQSSTGGLADLSGFTFGNTYSVLGSAAGEVVDVSGFRWGVDIHGNGSSKVGSVASLRVNLPPPSAASMASTKVDVSSASAPAVVFGLKIAEEEDGEEEREMPECRYWDDAKGAYSAKGLLTVAVRGPYIVCQSMHLTDFAGGVSESMPDLYLVDPINDAALLERYKDPTNAFVLVSLVSFMAFFLASCVCGQACDICDRRRSPWFGKDTIGPHRFEEHVLCCAVTSAREAWFGSAMSAVYDRVTTHCCAIGDALCISTSKLCCCAPCFGHEKWVERKLASCRRSLDIINVILPNDARNGHIKIIESAFHIKVEPLTRCAPPPGRDPAGSEVSQIAIYGSKEEAFAAMSSPSFVNLVQERLTARAVAEKLVEDFVSDNGMRMTAAVSPRRRGISLRSLSMRFGKVDAAAKYAEQDEHIESELATLLTFPHERIPTTSSSSGSRSHHSEVREQRDRQMNAEAAAYLIDTVLVKKNPNLPLAEIRRHLKEWVDAKVLRETSKQSLKGGKGGQKTKKGTSMQKEVDAAFDEDDGEEKSWLEKCFAPTKKNSGDHVVVDAKRSKKRCALRMRLIDTVTAQIYPLAMHSVENTTKIQSMANHWQRDLMHWASGHRELNDDTLHAGDEGYAARLHGAFDIEFMGVRCRLAEDVESIAPARPTSPMKMMGGAFGGGGAFGIAVDFGTPDNEIPEPAVKQEWLLQPTVSLNGHVGADDAIVSEDMVDDTAGIVLNFSEKQRDGGASSIGDGGGGGDGDGGGASRNRLTSADGAGAQDSSSSFRDVVSAAGKEYDGVARGPPPVGILAATAALLLNVGGEDLHGKIVPDAPGLTDRTASTLQLQLQRTLKTPNRRTLRRRVARSSVSWLIGGGFTHHPTHRLFVERRKHISNPPIPLTSYGPRDLGPKSDQIARLPRWKRPLFLLASQHPYISVWFTRPMHPVTRPMRVAILCAMALTQLAVNALIFGRGYTSGSLESEAEPDRVNQKVFIALFSALCMLPSSLGFHYLFHDVRVFKRKKLQSRDERRRYNPYKKADNRQNKAARLVAEMIVDILVTTVPAPEHSHEDLVVEEEATESKNAKKSGSGDAAKKAIAPTPAPAPGSESAPGLAAGGALTASEDKDAIASDEMMCLLESCGACPGGKDHDANDDALLTLAHKISALRPSAKEIDNVIFTFITHKAKANDYVVMELDGAAAIEEKRALRTTAIVQLGTDLFELGVADEHGSKRIAYIAEEVRSRYVRHASLVGELGGDDEGEEQSDEIEEEEDENGDKIITRVVLTAPTSGDTASETTGKWQLPFKRVRSPEEEAVVELVAAEVLRSRSRTARRNRNAARRLLKVSSTWHEAKIALWEHYLNPGKGSGFRGSATPWTGALRAEVVNAAHRGRGRTSSKVVPLDANGNPIGKRRVSLKDTFMSAVNHVHKAHVRVVNNPTRRKMIIKAQAKHETSTLELIRKVHSALPHDSHFAGESANAVVGSAGGGNRRGKNSLAGGGQGASVHRRNTAELRSSVKKELELIRRRRENAIEAMAAAQSSHLDAEVRAMELAEEEESSEDSNFDSTVEVAVDTRSDAERRSARVDRTSAKLDRVCSVLLCDGIRLWITRYRAIFSVPLALGSIIYLCAALYIAAMGVYIGITLGWLTVASTLCGMGALMGAVAVLLLLHAAKPSGVVVLLALPAIFFLAYLQVSAAAMVTLDPGTAGEVRASDTLGNYWQTLPRQGEEELSNSWGCCGWIDPSDAADDVSCAAPRESFATGTCPAVTLDARRRLSGGAALNGTMTQLGCKVVLSCHIAEHRLDSPHFMGLAVLVAVLVILAIIVAVERPPPPIELAPQEVHVLAASKVQSHFRVHLAKSFIRRRKVYKKWETRSWVMTLVTRIVWFALIMYIAFMFYINLIYGVKFDSEQSRWWVIASFSGMMIDMCIQEPIVTAFSVVKFDEGVQALWLSSGLDAIIECVFESIGWM